MGERERWERRYQQSDGPFYGRDASQFLQRSLPLLPASGTCLDLAGGEGRNAVFLAQRGFEVTLADVAVAGLARAAELARHQGVALRIVAADLGRSPLVDPSEGWNLILLMNYHDRSVLAAAGRRLSPGGAVVVEGFAKEQLGRGSGGPPDPDLLWARNEIVQLLLPLRLVWYEDRLVEADDNPRHRGSKWVVRAVARRET
jgi:SAM-dependent methyltransferase